MYPTAPLCALEIPSTSLIPRRPCRGLRGRIEGLHRAVLRHAQRKQRRLYAGLESIKYGRGGDKRLAALLQLDPHTVARGRKERLEQEVDSERVRKTGGGRKGTEKKRPT